MTKFFHDYLVTTTNVYPTNHIDHLIDRVIIEAQLGGTDILRHIDGSSIRTKQ